VSLRTVLFAFVLAARCASAQSAAATTPLRVNVLRSFDAGRLLAGVDDVRGASDGGAALFEVIGPPNGVVVITFTLPGAMRGDAASPLVLDFGPSSAEVAESLPGVGARAFDPRQPYTLQLPASGRAIVALGASLRVPRAQGVGRYAGAATLSVRQLP